MFESITFGRDSLVDLTSLGELAECLLYYKIVHAVVDHGSFTRLARVCGPETLLGLIEDGHLALTYLENRPVVATRPVGGREQHGFGFVQGKGKESQNLVPELFQDLTGKRGRGRRLASRLLDRLSTKTYAPDDFSQSLGAIEDATYTDRLVPQILAARGVSHLPGAPRFRVHREENAVFSIETNLDFPMLNAEYRRTHPDHNLAIAKLAKNPHSFSTCSMKGTQRWTSLLLCRPRWRRPRPNRLSPRSASRRCWRPVVGRLTGFRHSRALLFHTMDRLLKRSIAGHEPSKI